MPKAIQINPFERPKIREFDLKDSYQLIQSGTGVDKTGACFARTMLLQDFGGISIDLWYDDEFLMRGVENETPNPESTLILREFSRGHAIEGTVLYGPAIITGGTFEGETVGVNEAFIAAMVLFGLELTDD